MAYIPKTGITTGQLILASNITSIIDSLDGTGTFEINATGSFSGSFKGSLIGSSSFATTATTATTASFATTASKVSVLDDNGNNNHKVVFVNTATASGGDQILIDPTATQFTYNPHTNLLTVTASLAQTASFATSSSFASFATSSSFATSAVTASLAATATSAVTSQTASYSTTLGATISNVKDEANSLGAVALQNSDGSQISITGHFSASYAFTASYALNAGGASGSTPGGSNTQLQFNDNGSFGGTDTASTKYTFTGSLAISGSVSGSSNTIVNLSNLGNASAIGKLIIPTSPPSQPVHGTMYMDAPGMGSVTLYIYNGNAGQYRSVTLS